MGINPLNFTLSIIIPCYNEINTIEEVLIKADGNASSGTLSKVIRMIRNTGIKRAAIVTKSVL